MMSHEITDVPRPDINAIGCTESNIDDWYLQQSIKQVPTPQNYDLNNMDCSPQSVVQH